MIKKVLVVEDSGEVRLALEMALEEEGYSVRAGRNGNEGLDLFREFSPDIALLDVRMPGLSGIELCAIIRETSNIPVIIFSAVEEQAEKISAFEKGADDYVIKGTGVDELLARVAAHLRWDRVRRKDEDHEEDGREDGQSSTAFQVVSGGVYEGLAVLPGPERPITVLVADPDPETRSKQIRILQRLGYRVVVSERGRQTLRMTGRHLPDLILLDVLMPDFNGFQVLSTLRTHPRTKDIPVIVVSRKGSPEDLALARENGAVDYVVKGWSDGEIELRVQWAIEKSKRRLGMETLHRAS